MNRESIYYLPADSTESTFCYDEDRPPLPLPKLDHTLKRYLESLKPFGTAEELENTKKIIETFRKGVGAKLQSILDASPNRSPGLLSCARNESHIFGNI